MVYRTAMPHLTQVTKFRQSLGYLVRRGMEFGGEVISQD